MIQDPFELDFCVTKAYNSYDWEDMCKITHEIICKWQGKEPANLLDIFDRNDSKIIQHGFARILQR